MLCYSPHYAGEWSFCTQVVGPVEQRYQIGLKLRYTVAGPKASKDRYEATGVVRLKRFCKEALSERRIRRDSFLLPSTEAAPLGSSSPRFPGWVTPWNQAVMSTLNSVLRLGVLGYGSLVQGIHLPVLRRIPNVTVTAVAEPDAARRESAQRLLPGAFTTPDWREVIGREDVDALLIALPNALHAPAAVAAFGSGKHVYLEKPLATSAAEGETILSAWRAAPGCVGMMGFNYRFNPLYEDIRQRIAGGEIGELVGVRSAFATPAANALPEWKRKVATGGGALLDLASHHTDLLPFLTGKPITEVSALQLSQRSEQDSAVLNLRLGADGPLAQVFVTLCAIDDDKWEFYGQTGKLSVDRYESFEVRYSPPRRQDVSRVARIGQGMRSLPNLSYLLRKRRSVGHEPSFRMALAHFVSAARGAAVSSSTAVASDLADGLRSLTVIEAANESFRTGKVISLV